MRTAGAVRSNDAAQPAARTGSAVCQEVDPRGAIPKSFIKSTTRLSEAVTKPFRAARKVFSPGQPPRGARADA